jgi:hypothetical protein
MPEIHSGIQNGQVFQIFPLPDDHDSTQVSPTTTGLAPRVCSSSTPPTGKITAFPAGWPPATPGFLAVSEGMATSSDPAQSLRNCRLRPRPNVADRLSDVGIEHCEGSTLGAAPLCRFCDPTCAPQRWPIPSFGRSKPSPDGQLFSARQPRPNSSRSRGRLGPNSSRRQPMVAYCFLDARTPAWGT